MKFIGYMNVSSLNRYCKNRHKYTCHDSEMEDRLSRMSGW